MKNPKNQLLKLSGMLFLLVFVSSCAKDEVGPDKEKPTLTWLKTIGAQVSLNTTVPINFRVDDNVALKWVTVTVTNSTENSVYLEKTETTNAKSIVFNESIVTAITTTMADFVVKIEAQDQAGNKEVFTKSFHAMNGGGGGHGGGGGCGGGEGGGGCGGGEGGGECGGE